MGVISDFETSRDGVVPISGSSMGALLRSSVGDLDPVLLFYVASLARLNLASFMNVSGSDECCFSSAAMGSSCEVFIFEGAISLETTKL